MRRDFVNRNEGVCLSLLAPVDGPRCGNMMDVAEVAGLLALDASDARTSLVLQFLINAATSAIQAYVDRKLIAADYVDTYVGPQTVITLFEFPVIRVNSVTVNAKVLDPAQYRLDQPSGRLLPNMDEHVHWYWLDTPFDNSPFIGGHVEVSYRAGYEPADLPYDIKTIVVDYCRERFTTYKQGVLSGGLGDALSNPANIRSVNLAGIGSVTLASGASGTTGGTKTSLARGGPLLGNASYILDKYRDWGKVIAPNMHQLVTVTP